MPLLARLSHQPLTAQHIHPCPHCSYRATTKNSLVRHIRSHTGERPYGCPHCDYRAIQKSDIDKHARRIHKELYPPAQISTEPYIQIPENEYYQ